jgi:hypothetical protein
VLIAAAVVVIALASAGYMRSTTTPQVVAAGSRASPQAQGGPATIPFIPPSPTPSRRSGGLLPDGSIAVLIEQFGGLNDQPPLGLKSWVQITDAAAISKLVRDLNALPPFPGGIFCPEDDGSYFELIFTYSARTRMDVKVEARGCGEVYVGGSTQAVAWTLTSPAFIDALSGLVAARQAS